jgi:hypothetical protein
VYGLIELADIKKDLPHWPDEVIEEWLIRLANRGPDTGWPLLPSPWETFAWKYILGGRPLSWWKEVTWKPEDSDLTLTHSAMPANGLSATCSMGPSTASQTRFLRFRTVGSGFIDRQIPVREGTFPKPPLVIRKADGLSVLDGNRVSALCFRRLAPARIVEIKRSPLIQRLHLVAGMTPSY